MQAGARGGVSIVASMSAAARAIRWPDIGTASLIAVVALASGAFAVQMPQLAVTMVFLVLLVAVRMQSRTAGVVALWGVWLLAPAFRRILDLTGTAPAVDPLSVLPFVGTAVLAAMELHENGLDRRARVVVALAGLGLLFGVPSGIVADPAAASFAAIAYGAALAAFVLGWGDEVRSSATSNLERALVAVLPPLAFYGIAQYFFPLFPWDANWVEAGELGSIGAPQEDRIRVFATLNAPFTFAMVLALGLVLGLGKQRNRADFVAVLPLVVALALTFVRSAWLALIVGLLVYLGSARGRGAGRIVAVVAVSVGALVVIGGSNPTTKAFTERVTSLGDPESDVSAQDRLEITNRLVPEAIQHPLGAGTGQTGLSSRFDESAESNLVDVDDGYLSVLYQSGPVGLLLVLTAMVASVAAAVQALGRAPPEQRSRRAALVAAIVMLLVAEASADVLFGVTGAVFWYLCGISVAAASRERQVRAARAAS